MEREINTLHRKGFFYSLPKITQFIILHAKTLKKLMMLYDFIRQFDKITQRKEFNPLCMHEGHGYIGKGV